MVADRLAPRELLGELPPDVELIDVAKLPRGRSAQQEEINRVIVERALAGKRVVRFKGGDNFVFGRGYEEVLACREAGVPVTVIPGLTSPIAVPAVAGIPVTHRGVAHEFTVISGHLPPGHPDSLVDWEARRRPARHPGADDGGRERRRDRRRPWSPAAAPPATPVAVVCDGTMPGERTVLSTLGDLAADLSAAQVVGRRRSSWSARWSRSRTPTRYRRLMADLHRGHRPRRPPARRLPRPARRRAAQAPRGRARALPRRGREGRTPGGRGRLHAAVVPDGAALAGGARRRAGDAATRRASWSPRRWPRRSPASTSTAARWPRSSAARCRPSGRCSPGARSVLVLEDIVDHTNVGAIFRSGAALGFDAVLLAPRCADPLYRRSIKVAMGAVFTLPWTRLPDWYDALPVPVRGRLHHGGPDPGRRRRRRSRRRSPASTGSRWCSAPRGTGSRPRWETVGRPARGHPDARGHRLPQRRRRHRRRLLRHRPALTGPLGDERLRDRAGRLAVPPHAPDRERLSARPLVDDDLSCFDDVTRQALAPMLVPEEPRAGELDRAECGHCRPSEHTLWADDLWQVRRRAGTGWALPYVGGIAPREHHRLEDAAGRAADHARAAAPARSARRVKAIPGVARCHFARWGDGSEHFHLWALAQARRDDAGPRGDAGVLGRRAARRCRRRCRPSTCAIVAESPLAAGGRRRRSRGW